MNINLSIISVTLNDLSGLKRTYESILPLLYDKNATVEWVVIDGDSTDGTKEYIAKYNHPNIKWLSEPDNGMYDAMNKGIKLASGKYLLFLNAGDYLSKEGQVELKNQLPDHHFIFYNLKKVDRNLKPVSWTLPKSFLKDLSRHAAIPHQSTLIHKDTFKQYGLYDVSFQYFGDYDFFFRVLNQSNENVSYTCYFDKKISVFVLDGITSKYQYSIKLLRECNDIQRKYFGRISVSNALSYMIKYLISCIPFHGDFINVLRHLQKNR